MRTDRRQYRVNVWAMTGGLTSNSLREEFSSLEGLADISAPNHLPSGSCYGFDDGDVRVTTPLMIDRIHWRDQ